MVELTMETEGLERGSLQKRSQNLFELEPSDIILMMRHIDLELLEFVAMRNKLPKEDGVGGHQTLEVWGVQVGEP